jgi:hypothetical protein
VSENVYLILGCYGRTENEFVLCPSINNRILKIDDTLIHIDEIMDYFDSIKLFDRPLLDNNSINHLIYNLQDRFDQKIKRLWTDHQYNLIERFMHMHKPCGLYSQLILVEEELVENITKEDIQISFVSGFNAMDKKERKSSIASIRTRKY